MDTTTDIDAIALLDEGLSWATDRLALVTVDRLDAPTPCEGWILRDLLDHVLDTVGVFADAVDGPGGPPDDFARLADRIRHGWTDPAAVDRTYDVRFGVMPGPVLASANLLEVVVHAWDVAQATGEDVAIPDRLAAPVLAFARAAITDDGRAGAFGPALDAGTTPGEQLLAFLGRRPR